jgi:hypothetical protein
MEKLTKFQTIALPLVKRGFWVTPVRPDAKAGAAGKWNYWQYRTVEDVLTKYVEKYAACNGGVVGKSGVGNMMFVDDDGGLPADVRERLPRTYTVQTRPNSTHRHFYFSQTEYSVRKFGRNAKTVNIRDFNQIVTSPTGGLMYKTLYDIKGIGGASLVVAAGSTKPNGDVYTCVDDALVAPVPNWLVDWILEQQRDFKIAHNRVRAEKLKAKRRAAEIDPAERERLRALGHPDGFDIFAIDRRAFITSRAFKFARLGIVGEQLVSLLISQAALHIEGGAAYCKTDRGVALIHGIARNAEKATEKARIKEAADFYHKKNDVSMGLTVYGEIPEPVRRDVLQEIIHEFPDKLAVEDADARLTSGMQFAGLTFDKRRDKNALSDLRRKEGFEVGTTYWKRLRTPFPSSHITGEGRDTSRGGRSADGTLMSLASWNADGTLPTKSMSSEGVNQ